MQAWGPSRPVLRSCLQDWSALPTLEEPFSDVTSSWSQPVYYVTLLRCSCNLPFNFLLLDLPIFCLLLVIHRTPLPIVTADLFCTAALSSVDSFALFSGQSRQDVNVGSQETTSAEPSPVDWRTPTVNIFMCVYVTHIYLEEWLLRVATMMQSRKYKRGVFVLHVASLVFFFNHQSFSNQHLLGLLWLLMW